MDQAARGNRLQLHVHKSRNKGRHGQTSSDEEPQRPTKTPRAASNTKRREQPASTNISSPPHQGPARRRIQTYQNSEDDEDDDFTEILGRAADRRPRIDISDDEIVEPQRKAKTTRRRLNASKELGPPIETDEQMNKLTETQVLIVDGFVHSAKQECQKLAVADGLRSAPFTDTVLRKMALKRPRTLEEMKKVSGIDPDKVALYGKNFLKMIKNAEEAFNLKGNRQSRPQDPNRTIDLVSDEDDDAPGGDEDYESDYSQPAKSQHMPSTRVQEFNERIKRGGGMTAVDRVDDTAPSQGHNESPPTNQSVAGNEGKGPNARNGFAKSGRRKNGSGHGANEAKCSKKRFSKANGNNGKAKKYNNSRTNGKAVARGGGGGGGGVAAMPT